MFFTNTGNAGHDLPRCAVATLEGIMIDKGLLHWMQVVAFRKSLDRGDIEIVDLHGECHAGGDPATVNMHGTSATLSVITPFLGAGQAKLVA